MGSGSGPDGAAPWLQHASTDPPKIRGTGGCLCFFVWRGGGLLGVGDGKTPNSSPADGLLVSFAPQKGQEMRDECLLFGTQSVSSP